MLWLPEKERDDTNGPASARPGPQSGGRRWTEVTETEARGAVRPRRAHQVPHVLRVQIKSNKFKIKHPAETEAKIN